MSTVVKHPRATIITIYSLGMFLGLLHIFIGVIALTPAISQDYHRELKVNYNAFAKHLVFIHQFVDKVPLALYLRNIISIAQVVFGTLLLENGYFGIYGKIGNYGLIGLDLSYLLLQLGVGNSFERIAPTVVFAVLLVTRLLIVEQSSRKLKSNIKTRNAGKPKTSTPKKNKNE